LTSKENVKRAIHFNNPEYIPLMYYKLDRIENSDIAFISIVEMFGGHNGRTTEWGFEWVEDSQVGYTIGQTKTPAIPDWSDLPRYKAFDVNRSGRFDNAKKFMAEYPDRYFIADFVLSGMHVLSFVRGFVNFMMDLYDEPENIDKLSDIIFAKEEEMIRECARQGFDAICLADDWGSQRSLLISHDLFLRFFKPRYKHEIELAHSLGLDVFLHSCGYIIDIIPDLIEIGLDVLNPGQPFLNGIEAMGKNWGGKICFGCPVSYQTTGVSGKPEEIEQEILDYVTFLSGNRGGFLGFVATDLESLGATAEIQENVLTTWHKYCGRSSQLR